MPLFANSEADGAAVCPKPLKDIDWKKLRRQKRWLLTRYNQAVEGKDSLGKGSSMGLLNLVDAIQEYAVEEFGFSPEQVWGPEAVGDPIPEALELEAQAA